VKVLFVSSGNSKNGISSIVYEQGESLKLLGYEIDYFLVKGKGIKGYLSNLFLLRNTYKLGNYDIVHAHNIFCGFLCGIALLKPLVVSLMGWNVQKYYLKILIYIFNFIFWDYCIVKSQSMQLALKNIKVEVIPNGVDINFFKPMNKKKAQEYLNWDLEKKHFLFAADPKIPIKNYSLCKQAFDILYNDKYVLHTLGDVKRENMPYYYNASDVVIFTSKGEGSPNVIKEAMACNCKIVSVRVGDVPERFADVQGCFLCKYQVEDVAFKIIEALKFPNEKVTSREKILSLNSSLIADRLSQVYHSVVLK